MYKVLGRLPVAAFAVATMLLSCNFQPPVTVSDQPELSGSTDDNRTHLAVLKSQSKHTSSVEELTAIVNKLFQSDTDARSAASAGDVAGSVRRLNLAAGKRFAANARSAGDLEEPVEIYGIETKIPGKDGGFVLASNDNRLGTILAVVDEGSLDNVADDPFMQIFFANLDSYVDSTIAEYNSITDGEIAAALAKIRNSGNDSRYTIYGEGGEYDETGSGSIYLDGQDNLGNGLDSHFEEPPGLLVMADWTWTDGHYATVTTAWKDDASVYNGMVRIINGDYESSIFIGSGHVALAQLMAYHGYPATNTYNDPANATDDLFAGYPYNWAAMTAAPDANNITANAKMAVGVLMYEIGGYGNADYSQNPAAMTEEGMIDALESIGYIVPDYTYYLNGQKAFLPYDTYAVRESIVDSDGIGGGDDPRPVLMHGWSKQDPFNLDSPPADAIGHAWIIDGYRYMEYTEIFSSVNYRSFSGFQSYVHCNMGFGPNNDEDADTWYNGWYLSGIFNTESKSRARTVQEQDEDYSHYVRMLPDVAW
jgi:hypothetical protein